MSITQGENTWTPVNSYQPSKMSSIKSQTVFFLLLFIYFHCFCSSVSFVDSLHLVLGASRGKGHGWRSVKCLFYIYPLYCQLGSHIPKSMIGYPYPLRDDTEMADNKERFCLNGEWECVYGHKEEKREGTRISKMTARELKLRRRICLTFPWSCPRALGFPILREKDLFSIYFIFISVSNQLFIQWLVWLLVSERGAVKSITLTVLT